MNRPRDSFDDEVAWMYPEIARSVDTHMTKNVTLCVTSACQLRCTYCYERHKGDSYMTFDTAKKYIDMLIDQSKGMDEYVNPDHDKFIILEFIGGEPLLAVDLIDKVLEYWVDRLTELNHPWLYRWRASISSNGVAYFDDRVQEFLRKWQGCVSMGISVDGNKELHDSCRFFKGTTMGSYDIAHAAAMDLKSTYNHAETKMTYAPENISHMYDAMMAMIDDGYTTIHSNCAYEPEYTLEDARIFYEQGKRIADDIIARGLDMTNEYLITIFDAGMFRPKSEDDQQNWCGGLGNMLSCDYDGNLYPCLRYMSMSLGDDQPPLIIGDVDDGILATPEQRKIIDDMKKVTRRSQSTDECYHCPIAEGCSWCSAWNYQWSGSFDKRCTNICPMHKARALFNYYFWNKYFVANDEPQAMKVFIPEEWALEIIDEDEWKLIKGLEREAMYREGNHIPAAVRSRSGQRLLPVHR